MSDYEFEEFEPNVNCFKCGERVKIFPAGILVGYTLLDHVRIVKNLWHEAMKITTSFDFDHEEMADELEDFLEGIQRMLEVYRPKKKTKWYQRKK